MGFTRPVGSWSAPCLVHQWFQRENATLAAERLADLQALYVVV